ncbi:PqiB family protein [Shewanella sp. NIFS-20-20]|uniref:PqiB family protein n=1 Tax=Shewanella sp. NIFS-20-20 TaxID=2853806 RepID=UPI001C464E67|nr:MlaD family protein [Shewanella sp. NIFS-20-20]MBV7314604.1 MCE family protein [Shewanella sp. NIFS-20-20]
MNQVQAPKIVKKKLFSPIWLLPIVALALATWLGVQSIRQSGVEIQIHFPSGTGIDIGKTLVRYEGLTVGKVTDIAIDKELQGVDVTVLMDYRSEPFLTKGTDFWLVKPKASITGIEGLDTLFSGNYIAILPGKGNTETHFTALSEAPPILPGKKGKLVNLIAENLGSLDVGSFVFYRQIPVGSVVSYRLLESDKLSFTIFIKEKYADLVKSDSRFWDVSGISVDASLSGIKVQSESIAAILAGGVSFSSGHEDSVTDTHNFTLYPSEDSARGGIDFTLDIADANRVHNGTVIQYLGLAVGDIVSRQLVNDGIRLHARIYSDYQHLLGTDSQFYLAGPELSFEGIKHAARLITGDNIILVPTNQPEDIARASQPALHFPLLLQPPTSESSADISFNASSQQNLNISVGAPLQYKRFTIGQVDTIELSDDFSQVNYQLSIKPEFVSLLTQRSYIIPQPLVAVEASLSGIQVQTGDIKSALTGALELVGERSGKPLSAGQSIKIYPSEDLANQAQQRASELQVNLVADNAAGLSIGSQVLYKKMAIGEVTAIDWQADDTFTISLGIQHKFAQLVNEQTVFWQNSAVQVAANLQGVTLDVAPLGGLLEGSLSLGLLNQPRLNTQLTLYPNRDLAMAQVESVRVSFPASVSLKAGADVRYQGYRVGTVASVELSQDLASITANVYLDGKYAEQFVTVNSQYVIVDAQISLRGIKAPETLITGPYISVTPGNDPQAVDHFVGKTQSKVYANSPDGSLQLTLVRQHLGSINQGSGIFYRGLAIGQVAGFELAANGQNVNIFIEINPEYRQLVNQSSRFFDISGFNMEFGLFSGAEIETSSLESLIAGGIALVTENKTDTTNQLSQGASLLLYDKAQPQWLDWQPILD